MLRKPLATLFAFCLIGSIALGLGADHPKGDLSRGSHWSEDLYQLVNQPNRVHGFWVNSTDYLFYQGNPAQLNAMLEGLAALPDANLTVILHVGQREAKSPWSRISQGASDWSVKVSSPNGQFGGPATHYQVDVYLGPDIHLPELKVPKSAKVESAGEIETFIRQHQERSAATPASDKN